MRVVDSHTGGEPTRVVVEGGPEVGRVSMAEARELLRAEHDGFRRAVTLEPRGSNILVGAILLPPKDPECQFGVVFFNNVGYLGMCGHGLIGLAETLRHLGLVGTGSYRAETPVGAVTFSMLGDGNVRIHNVPSRRTLKDVKIDVPGLGEVVGDVAYGGNWFFIQTIEDRFTIDDAAQLTEYASFVRRALADEGITGDGGEEIDHVELVGPPADPENDARNFVLCPGLAFDRSPCGTGTSAKLACLAADGKLAPQQVWRQESILGSVFEGEYARRGDDVLPSVTGRAFVTAESVLLFDDADPFREGFST